MGISKFIARQFGKPAGFCGRIVTAIMNRQNYPMYEETVRLLSPRDSDRILDIGCGNGYVLEMLSWQHGCEYSGIDISESILRAAARRNRKSVKSGKMSFECCEASEMPFPDKVFDKAYTVNTVYFWGDLIKTVAEIKRVLKPGGRFVNTLYTNETLDRFSHTQFEYKRFSREQLANAAREVGFSVEIVPIVNGAAYCVVCHV